MQIGTLEYLISINNSNVDSDLKKAESKVKGWGDKLSAWTVAKGQMMGNLAEKAVSAVASAVKNTFKAAISSYADYEQLVGGIDTLFKDSSAKVQQYAAKAYQTVGVSANQYMETVTSFSASLLQSLGGDTDKAADIADMAMKDMSDNVNKMGSSMESVEAAYKGFAKQNYTMLDNLKLGYGGTASEMERLLKDATKLTGKKYNIKNLSDIYEAIHAIQEEYEITGTTQNEALTTITGSLNATKAAWQDVLVAMASGKGVKKAISNFANSAKTTIKNLKPVVMETVKGLGTAAKELFPEIVSIAKDVVSYLYQGISNWFNKNIWQPIVDYFNEAWATISQLWELAQSNISKAWFAIASWFETYVWKPLAEFFTNAWDTIKQLWEGTQQAISSAWSSIANWFDTTVWKPIADFFSAPWETITKLWTGIREAISAAWASIANWFDTTVWKPISEAVSAPVEAVKQLWDGVRESISQAWSGIANWFNTTVWEPIRSFFEPVWNFITNLWTDISTKISDAWSTVEATISPIIDPIKKVFEGLASAVSSISSAVETAISWIESLLGYDGKSVSVKSTITKEVINVEKGSNGETTTTYEDGSSTTTWDNGGTSGGRGFAKGNWNVSYDQTALLHRGEMVLTKSQARQYRNGGSNDYEAIGSIVATAVSAAMNKVNVLMSGEKVGDLTTKRVKNNINSSSYSRLRAFGG